ncbi:MAG: RNA-binding transcriptional accessory protein, partial [Defluviitaleaceae bacterium]|nr:RNA-binding transcriptional accessory protein [Defluviitaleaceae bacterium]
MDIQKALCQEYGLKTFQVENTVKLIDEGNTIPFIARYRKELTGSLDDQVLRELSDRLAYLRGLDERRAQIRGSIAEQGKLTDEISRAIDAAQTLAALEDIYRPYKPKRRTRATIAKERGLEPLAVIILGQDLTGPLEEAALAFVDAGKEVPTAGDAIQGACDIIAEMISDDAGYRATVRQMSRDSGLISSSAADAGKESVYEMYYDYQEPVSKIAGHRVLAVNRGEAEGFLKVKLETPVDNILAALNAEIVRNNYYTRPAMERTVEDAYSRLIAPSIERELR